MVGGLQKYEHEVLELAVSVMKNGGVKDKQYSETTHTINDTNATQPCIEEGG